MEYDGILISHKSESATVMSNNMGEFLNILLIRGSQIGENLYSMNPFLTTSRWVKRELMHF